MSARRLACLAAAIGVSFAAAPAQSAEQPRAVVELFTSQGCSSCPPADKLLGQFAKEPGVIALSLSVDYWDYLGWKDTLALAGHAKRQQAYARARGDREVYTPQMVVNGISHVLGSDRSAVETRMKETRRQATVLAVPVTIAVADGTVTVTVASGKSGSAEVWLCPVTSRANIMIERGENRGNTIAYHNVVRRWYKVGTWSGAAATFTVPIAEFTKDKDGAPIANIDSVAVLVQSGAAAEPGVMLGAAIAALKR